MDMETNLSGDIIKHNCEMIDCGRYQMNKGPNTINLELTVRCNINCKMCLRSQDGYSLPHITDMSIETVKSVLPIMKDAICIWLSGFGEPLMHDGLIDIVKMVRSVNQTAKVAFTTNFVLMSDKKINELVDAGLSTVQVSIDGDNELGHAFSPTNEGVERYQKVLWERLELFKRIKDQREVRTPELQFAFVAMKRNVDQLESIIRRGLGVGLSSIVVVPVRDLHGALGAEDLFECRDYAVPYIRKAKAFAEANGVEFIFRFMDEKISVVRQPCNNPWTFFNVAVDGTVYVCCGGIFSGLNVNDVSAEQVWNSSVYLQLRQEWSTGKLRRKCWECPLVSPTTKDEDVILHGLKELDRSVLVDEILSLRRYVDACHERESQASCACSNTAMTEAIASKSLKDKVKGLLRATIAR